MSDNSAPTSNAFTDLMTSLLVLFVLLLVCTLYKIAQDKEAREKREVETSAAAADVSQSVRKKLHDLGLTLEPVPDDPYSEFIRLDENKVHFETGEPKEGSTQTALDASGANVIDRVSDILAEIICSKEGKSIDSIIIEGHTDKQGDADLKGKLDNLRLSQRRSYAVMEEIFHYLNSAKPKSLECFRKLSRSTGRGSVDPAKKCLLGKLTEVRRDDENRRVEIKIRFQTRIVAENTDPSSFCDRVGH